MTELDGDATEYALRLLDLAREGNEKLLEYIDQGVPVNLQDPDGNSLLMLAAYHGHAHVVTGLAARGADPNVANLRGQTPLAGAVFKGNDAIVATLLSAGADPALGQPSALDTARMFGKKYFE